MRVPLRGQVDKLHTCRGPSGWGLRRRPGQGTLPRRMHDAYKLLLEPLKAVPDGFQAAIPRLYILRIDTKEVVAKEPVEDGSRVLVDLSPHGVIDGWEEARVDLIAHRATPTVPRAPLTAGPSAGPGRRWSGSAG